MSRVLNQNPLPLTSRYEKLPRTVGGKGHLPERGRSTTCYEVRMMQHASRVIAKKARLKYVAKRETGILRERRGVGFSYRAPPTVMLRDHLERIRALAIPPAWCDVWICADARGHLQATGRDARGRLQYRYHADWTKTCAAQKFEGIAAFGRALPQIRRRVARDLARSGLPRTKVLAAIVRLLERSLIRIGNDEYSRTNGSFGLTTLRKRHVKVAGDRVHFCFVGKSRIEHQIDVFAPAVAAVIRGCQRLPGRDLFQFEGDKGSVQDATAADLNAYLSEIAGRPVTAKNFRTWGATVLMHRALLERPAGQSQRDQVRLLRIALKEVAAVMGNTLAVCRKSYVHPELPRIFLEKRLRFVKRKEPVFGLRGLSPLERATLRLIETEV